MRKKKAQASIMEYILLTFFILLIIVALMFFLSWWQFSQIGMEEHKLRVEKTLFLAKYVSNSPYFVKENSIFDDAKLTAVKSLGSDICRDFEEVFGYNWFIRVRVFDDEAEIPCSWGNYPDCNVWDFCTKNQKNISRIIPVNIYRKILEENGIGIMEVGIYL